MPIELGGASKAATVVLGAVKAIIEGVGPSSGSADFIFCVTCGYRLDPRTQKLVPPSDPEI